MRQASIEPSEEFMDALAKACSQTRKYYEP